MADILTPEQVEALAAWIAEARQTHAEWVEHLVEHQDCPDAQAAGDVEHHATAVRHYDEIITLLADHDALTARAEAAERKVAAVRAELDRHTLRGHWECRCGKAHLYDGDPFVRMQLYEAHLYDSIRKALDGEAR